MVPDEERFIERFNKVSVLCLVLDVDKSHTQTEKVRISKYINFKFWHKRFLYKNKKTRKEEIKNKEESVLQQYGKTEK